MTAEVEFSRDAAERRGMPKTLPLGKVLSGLLSEQDADCHRLRWRAICVLIMGEKTSHIYYITQTAGFQPVFIFFGIFP